MSEDKEEREFLWSTQTISWLIVAMVYCALFLVSLKADKDFLAQRADKLKKAQPEEETKHGKSD